MRKVVIITSFISFILLSVGQTIRLLTNPANLVWPTLPWFFSTSLMIAGFAIMFVALICYTIYFYKQEQAKEQLFKRWQISTRTKSLLRSKAKKVKPYKREFWLQMALVISLGLVMMSTPSIDLILPLVVPYPTGPFTTENYIKQQEYEKTFPQIEATFGLLFWPGAPASIFICTFLSKDLASQNRKKP